MEVSRLFLTRVGESLLLEHGWPRSGDGEIPPLKKLVGRRCLMLAHARFVIGLDLSQFCFLIRRQNLHDFRFDALVFDLEIDHGLRILRRQRARLVFIERATRFESLHGLMVLVHLLHQRLQRRLLFFENCFDLSVLISGQVKLLEHMVKFAARTAVTVHTLSDRSCRRKHHRGADSENAVTSRFHWHSLWVVQIFRDPGISPNIVHK